MKSVLLLTACLVVSLAVVEGSKSKDVDSGYWVTKEKKVCVSTFGEIVFVLDSSTSIGPEKWNDVLKFVDDVVMRVNRRALKAKGGVKVGVVVYNNFAKVAIPLGSQADVTKLRKALKDIQFTEGVTNTGAGLLEAQKEFKRQGTKNVSRTIILITDGASNFGPNSLVAANDIKATGVTILSVGVTDQIRESELVDIASDDAFLHVHQFKDLPKFVSKIAVKVCETATTKAPQLTTTVSSDFCAPATSRRSPCENGEGAVIAIHNLKIAGECIPLKTKVKVACDVSPQQCYRSTRKEVPCFNGVTVVRIIRWMPEHPKRNRTDCLAKVSFVLIPCSTTRSFNKVTTAPPRPSVKTTEAPKATDGGVFPFEASTTTMPQETTCPPKEEIRQECNQATGEDGFVRSITYVKSGDGCRGVLHEEKVKCDQQTTPGENVAPGAVTNPITTSLPEVATEKPFFPKTTEAAVVDQTEEPEEELTTTTVPCNIPKYRITACKNGFRTIRRSYAVNLNKCTAKYQPLYKVPCPDSCAQDQSKLIGGCCSDGFRQVFRVSFKASSCEASVEDLGTLECGKQCRG